MKNKIGLEKKYIKQLDDILNYLYEIKEPPIERATLIEEGLKKGIILTVDDILNAANKLVKEGYIDKDDRDVIFNNIKVPNVRYYSINFEGRILKESGGYATLLIEKERIQSIAVNTYRATMWLAIGTMGLLTWEIIKWVVEHHCCYCHSY